MENMRKSEDDMNPLIPGGKIVGIFGYCDIRNFTDMTEILKEEVIVFVNEIAYIIHKNGIKFIYSHLKQKFIICMVKPIRMQEIHS